MSEETEERTIDAALFAEIKAAQEDEVSSADVAEEMNLSIERVNLVYAAKTYSSFTKESGTKAEIEQERLDPARAGYYKQIVARKYEENANLKDMRGMLMEQISYLRKAVGFLELRKAELERGVEQMEKTILNGIGAIDQLEETENLTKMTERTAKKNR